MPWFNSARCVLVTGGLLLGCGDPICGCSPVDPQASVVVTGVVLDTAAAPVVGAEVSIVGEVWLDCVRRGYWRYAIPDPAVTNGIGDFTLRIETLGTAGTHCVDLAARDPSSGAADTLFLTPASFREAPPWDTLDVQFAIPR